VAVLREVNGHQKEEITKLKE